MLKAITTWVEAGQPPEQIVAVKLKGEKPEDGVLRTRPLCPYPAKAEWDGHGDRDKAESWRCAGPAAKPT
jgi:feruloyl esterase